MAHELPANDPTALALRAHLKALIIKSCGILDVVPDQLTDDAVLFGGPPLNLTSLDAVEIAVALEFQFGVDLQNASSLREYFTSITAMAKFIGSSADPVKLRSVLNLG